MSRTDDAWGAPGHVAIIGGGRWARVLGGVLAQTLPLATQLSIHSANNASGMREWATLAGIAGRFRIETQMPQIGDPARTAIVVVNAASSHENAADWAITRGVPVLVEKPLTPSLDATVRLVGRAHSQGSYLAAAHVFRFARYVRRFSQVVREIGEIESVSVTWTDPVSEARYGENKSYDSGLPVYADLLPHVSALLADIMPARVQSCSGLEFARGGASLTLLMTVGGVPCVVKLGRNCPQRQRLLNVCGRNGDVTLDFSREPGIIRRGLIGIDGDPEWNVRHRPVASMLLAFLRSASSGVRDVRLDVQSALQSARLTEEVSSIYRPQQMEWITAKLGGAQDALTGDLEYALTEVLQFRGNRPAGQLRDAISRLLLKGQSSSRRRVPQPQKAEGFEDFVDKLTRAVREET
jgi:predicted dehydrogenase